MRQLSGVSWFRPRFSPRLIGPVLLSGVALATLAGPVRGEPASPAAVVAGELGQKLDAVARQAATEGFQGVVLVAKDGVEVLAKGYGVANRAAGTPFAVDTVVQIGSNVKDFTKVAILQLVEAGKLRLDDPLSRFFPQAPADKAGITVQQLLDHRAGLPLGYGRDEEAVGRDAFLARLFAAPLEAAPGSTERYSNAGYSVLAAIVEQLAGQSYDAYVDQAIFRPVGMRDTGLLVPGFDAKRLAHGYASGEDRGTMLDMPRLPDGTGWNMRGNGGHLSTVRDMRRFYGALADATLLRDADHRAMVLADGPNVLAGSDMICFFLFGSFPREGVQLLIATNDADWRAPKLLDLMGPLVGLPTGGRERRVGGGPPPAGATTTLPDDGPGRTVAAYLAAFNSGDAERMRRFFTEHLVSQPDMPPIEQRLANYRRMFGDLGQLTIESVTTSPDGIEVLVRGATGERAELGFILEATAPFRLLGLRIMIG